jgi:hypothetical protein
MRDFQIMKIPPISNPKFMPKPVLFPFLQDSDY